MSRRRLFPSRMRSVRKRKGQRIRRGTEGEQRTAVPRESKAVSADEDLPATEALRADDALYPRPTFRCRG